MSTLPRMRDVKTTAYKVGLNDLPDLNKALESLCKELDLDTWGSGAENWISELEYLSRDGFISSEHNHGGWDVYNTYASESAESEEDEDTILFHGFRFMYEGEESGIHTLCAYYCQWYEDDYRGISYAPTIAKIEIRFKTVASLIKKLRVFTSRHRKGE